MTRASLKNPYAVVAISLIVNILGAVSYCSRRNGNRLGLSSIVDVTTATTALLIAEVRLSEVRYAVQAGSVAVAYATGKTYQNY